MNTKNNVTNIKSSVLDRLIDWGLEHKFWVIILTCAFFLVTVYNVNNLTVDAVPDITNVQVVINTKTLGLDPEKIELTVTQPIELEMMGLPELHDMRSISKFGLSQVILIFEDQTDIYWARQIVSEKLQTLRSSLPGGLQPELAPISTGLGEVYMYALNIKPNTEMAKASKKDQLLYLREIQDYQVRPLLRKIKDVADIDSNGGYKKELHINLNPQKLIQNGVTIDNVQNKLTGLGESFGGGFVDLNNESLIIKSSTTMDTLSDFENLSLAQKFSGQQLLLKDVATVSFDAAPRIGAATYNGLETVMGTVLMTSGGNGRTVSLDVDEAIDKIVLPENVELVKLYSRGYLVNATLKTVIKNLSEGALLVILILLLVLGHFRAALIVSVVIPLSMLGTTLGMQIFNISGNLMSLGAIDFGLVVDGAVVLVETVIAGLYTLTATERLNLNKDQIIAAKAKQIMRPVVFGLFMIMIVYLPILLLEGIEGKMFRPMAYTVLMTLGWSLILTLFLVPVLMSLFIKIPPQEKALYTKNLAPSDAINTAPVNLEHETYLFKKLKSGYRPLLEKFIDLPKTIVAVCLIFLVVSLIIFSNLGSDFIPKLDEGDLVINITRDAKISLPTAIMQQEQVEQKIKSFKEVNFVFSRMGTPESATDPMGVHLTDTFVILNKNHKEWTFKSKDELFLHIKTAIESMGFANQDISSNQPIEMRFNEMLEGSRADISLKVIGLDLDYLVEAIDGFEANVKKVKGLESAEMDPLTALRKSDVIDIKPNFIELAKLNISLNEFNKTIVSYMAGVNIGQWLQGTRNYPIVLHLAENLRQNMDEIKTLPVPLPEGESVALNKIADIQTVSQVTTVARHWGQRYAALSLNVSNRDIMSFVQDIKKIIADHSVRADHRVELSGQFNNLNRAKQRLYIIIPITVLLILFILWREFSSFKDALLIFLCVPLATFGGILALFLRDIHLSLSAAVGFIALIGIALLNGIVLLTVFNQLRVDDRELKLRDLVIKGTMSRLRPVVMTALVASIGFIPMAINTGLGSEVQRPLATVVIGGILFSTLLTLVVFPCLYLYVHKDKNQ